MEQQSAWLMTQWHRPWWAQESASDEDAVIHSRHLGRVISLDGEEVNVELVQRDGLQWGSADLSIVRQEAWLRMGGFRFGIGDAVRLSEHLQAAQTWGLGVAGPPALVAGTRWVDYGRVAG